MPLRAFMPKSPDQKMASLERGIILWKTLAIAMIVVFFVSKRHSIVGWMDKAGGWMANVAQASASPVE